MWIHQKYLNSSVFLQQLFGRLHRIDPLYQATSVYEQVDILYQRQQEEQDRAQDLVGSSSLISSQSADIKGLSPKKGIKRKIARDDELTDRKSISTHDLKCGDSKHDSTIESTKKSTAFLEKLRCVE